MDNQFRENIDVNNISVENTKTKFCYLPYVMQRKYKYEKDINFKFWGFHIFFV